MVTVELKSIINMTDSELIYVEQLLSANTCNWLALVFILIEVQRFFQKLRYIFVLKLLLYRYAKRHELIRLHM